MKSLLLPLVACAALAGCADPGNVGYGAYGGYPAAPYGTAVYGSSQAYPYAYGSAPAYPYAYGASPVYPYSPYGAYGAYGGSGWGYGAPAVGLTINSGRFGDRHRGDRDWQRGDRDGHGGDRRGATAGVTRRGFDPNAMGAGHARMGRDNEGGRRIDQRGGGAREGGGAERQDHEHR